MNKIIAIPFLLLIASYCFSQDCNRKRFEELRNIPIKQMTDAQYQEYAELRDICWNLKLDNGKYLTLTSDPKADTINTDGVSYYIRTTRYKRDVVENLISLDPAANKYMKMSNGLMITAKILGLLGGISSSIFIVHELHNYAALPCTFVGTALISWIISLDCEGTAIKIYNNNLINQ